MVKGVLAGPPAVAPPAAFMSPTTYFTCKAKPSKRFEIEVFCYKQVYFCSRETEFEITDAKWWI